MKLYVLCITPRSLIDVDRRVLNQCEIFAENGWDVYLVIPHQFANTEKYGNIHLTTVLHMQRYKYFIAFFDPDYRKLVSK
jgi:hypothetical protein